MDVLIQAKAAEVKNMSQYELEKLKTDISLSRDLSAVARNYIDTAIENRELELSARDGAFVEASELKVREI